MMMRAGLGDATSCLPDGQKMSNGWPCGTPLSMVDVTTMQPINSGQCPPGYTKQLDPNAPPCSTGTCRNSWECFDVNGKNPEQSSICSGVTSAGVGGVPMGSAIPIAAGVAALLLLPGAAKLLGLVGIGMGIFQGVATSLQPQVQPDGSIACIQVSSSW